MHPYHSITLAHQHIHDLQASAERRRLVRRARRGGGARSPAPPAAAAPLAEPIQMRFLVEPDERRPAA